jgi:hypothetical protein
MELLGKIFGNPHRVKIMRLFLFNQKTPFTLDEVVRRCQVKKVVSQKELKQLTTIGFIKPKSFSEKVATKPTKKKPEGGWKRVKRKGWILNANFDLIEPLQNLVIDTELINSNDLVKRIRQAGNIKLLVLSGVFVRDDNRKLDLLVVGDKLKMNILKKQIAAIESEVGRELSYASFSVEEFQYRMSMYDKLLRDVLEYDHTALVNKLLD